MREASVYVASIKDAAGRRMSGGAAVKRPRAATERKEAKIYSDIALVTYESCQPAFCSCVCDDITEHVTNLGDSLHTYVCALGAAWHDNDMNRYYDGHELVPRENCRKTLVQQTSELKNIKCDLMVMLCHGNAGDHVTSPSMSFFDDRHDIPFSKKSCAENALMLYAYKSKKGRQDGPFAEVSMSEVVDDTSLCLVMCCSACEIVQAHLASKNIDKRRPDSHEFFFFSDRHDGVQNKGISGYSIEILISWIINLVEAPQMYDSGVSVLWRRAIVRIMQTVKVFDDDKQGFFDFLCAVGLVEDLDEAAKKMQLPWRHANGKETDRFRVGGHKLSWSKPEAIKALLHEFQTLTLVTVHGKAPGAKIKANSILTPAFSDDILLSSQTGIDTFLKEYKANKRHSESAEKNDSEMSMQTLRGCLKALQAMDV